MSPLKRKFGQYARRLEELGVRVVERVGMKRYTTFRIGGLAEVLAWPHDLAALQSPRGIEAKVAVDLHVSLRHQPVGVGP